MGSSAKGKPTVTKAVGAERAHRSLLEIADAKKRASAPACVNLRIPENRLRGNDVHHDVGGISMPRRATVKKPEQATDATR